ncbi:hypothetical protein EDB80DRAFT_559948 [Ilyonectria destructans]|nr:hypothetical protein EDB80DRAFT_559948 [Ilyonectria destructans]
MLNQYNHGILDPHPIEHLFFDRICCLGYNSFETRQRLTSESTADFDKAVQLAREALENSSDGRSDCAPLLSTLGSRLSDRHARMEQREDLDEAIKVAKGSLKPHKKTARYWVTRPDLSIRLGDRFSYTAEITDLEEATQLACKAVEATPKYPLDHIFHVNNLSSLLSDKYSCTRV